jgi:hypothetical protein
MWHRLSTMLCVSGFWLGLAVMPAQGSESRIHPFSITCNGTPERVDFYATDLGVSITRHIQGGAVDVFQPRGGLKFLRLEVAHRRRDKTVLVMGFNQVSARANLRGFIPVKTNASGDLMMQIIAACSGSGALQGHAIVYFL